MSTIKAPYNFVPLNPTIVQPYWTKYINHDLPFEDAESGCLEVTLVAASPIFVKNGMGKSEEETYFKIDKDKKRQGQKKPFLFHQDEKGQYFIPASSLKGMTRSVLEIMSFGRLSNKVNDVKYSVRDFHNNDIYPKSVISNKVNCGWLYQQDGEYYLENCGKPQRISHKAIDDQFHKNSLKMAEYFANRSNLKNAKTKSAKFKYEKFPQVQHRGRFRTYTNDSGYIRSAFDENGEIGTLVFTGQPGERKFNEGKNKWEGKFYEFVFFDQNTAPQKVDDEVIKNFFFAYYDHDITQQQDDWKWRKAELDKGKKIPIFYRIKNKKIQDMGLSMLYKITYNYSVKEAIQHHQSGNGYDLAEAIFGYVDESQSALKGRVHFGHAFAVNTPREDRAVKEVLAGPKASYYPTYIWQNPNKNGKVDRYQTFMTKAEVAGWKRYPIHTGKPKHNSPPMVKGKINEKILTQFTPLEAGATFKFKIRYHNLKKVELGALLSALTFHQLEDENDTYHSLGMAKALGYGKVKLTVKNLSEKAQYLRDFEAYMNVYLGNSKPEWTVLPQIRELLAMVTEQDNSKAGSQLEYMKLGKEQRNNAFTKAKKQKEGLRRYAQLVGSTKHIQPLCTPDDIAEMQRQCETEAAALSKQDSLQEILQKHIATKERELELLFFDKKQQWLNQLSARKAAIKQEEIERKKEKFAQQQAEKKQAVRDKNLKHFFKTKKVTKLDKNMKMRNFVEQYAEIQTKCKRKNLIHQFPDGFIQKADDQQFLFDFLLTAKQEGSSGIKKLFAKPFNAKHPIFKEVIKWVGTPKAEEWYQQINS